MLSYRGYLTETYAHCSLQHSPLNDQVGDSPYSTDGAAFYYFVFPNIMLNILPGRLQMNAVIPLAPDRTRVVFDYFYDTTDTIEAQQRVERDVAFSDRVQEEDITICGHVQRGLRSKAYDRGRFSVEMEEGVYHFQRLLKRAYRSALSRA